MRVSQWKNVTASRDHGFYSNKNVKIHYHRALYINRLENTSYLVLIMIDFIEEYFFFSVTNRFLAGTIM